MVAIVVEELVRDLVCINPPFQGAKMAVDLPVIRGFITFKH